MFYTDTFVLTTPFQEPYEVGTIISGSVSIIGITILILPMEKLRLREVKERACGHTVKGRARIQTQILLKMPFLFLLFLHPSLFLNIIFNYSKKT